MGGQGKEKPFMKKIGRLRGCLVLCTLALMGGVTLQQVSAETVLRVAMTAGDVPILIGQPDQGFEGYRFVGYNLYDSLILWDLSRADVVADLRPGLGHVLGGRSRQSAALDYHPAQRREVARWL